MAWRFEPGEELPHAFRRAAREEIARVSAGLRSGKDRARAVHEARQGFKRLRALVRLARPALGADFATENARWRDAGKLLSVSRDRTVMLESFDNTVSSCEPSLDPGAIADLRARIADGGAEAAAAIDEDSHTEEAIALLDAGAARLDALPWPAGAAALRASLRKSQKRLRRAWTVARETASPEVLHNWRKRVKDQSAQLRLLRAVLPEQYLTLRGEEKATAELLGEEHDLWLLSERLAQEEGLPPAAEPTRRLLLDTIEARRKLLRREAFRQGTRFSARKAAVFARTVVEAWEKAGVSVNKPRRKSRAAVGKKTPGTKKKPRAGKKVTTKAKASAEKKTAMQAAEEKASAKKAAGTKAAEKNVAGKKAATSRAR